MTDLKKIPRKKVVYLDCEYINEALGTGIRPRPDQWKEITQIGATLFDHELGKEVKSLNILVKPTLHTLTDDQWNDFFQLTHIRKEDLEKGISFEKAYKELLAFCESYPIVVMLGDQEVIRKNLSDLKMDEKVFDCFILGPMLGEKFKGICSGQLYLQVGLSKEQVGKGQTHDALFDARSMAWFVHLYRDK